MHSKRSTPQFPNSYALLSGREDARTAVLFVHGFAGNADSTWLDFRGMIDTGEEAEYWKPVDLYFYDYQTTSANIMIQAARLRRFLGSNFPRPTVDVLPDPLVASVLGLSGKLLPLTSQYDSLILVGHSLGGVIVRQMILGVASELQDQEEARDSITERTLASLNRDIADTDPDLHKILAATVRLFAPGLFGFEPTSLAGFVYNFAHEIPILNQFLRVTTASNAVAVELTVGSSRLAELRRRTEECAKRKDWNALRAGMLFGSKEDIVYMERYDCDPEIKIVELRDHTSVCKPAPDYTTPLEFVYGRSKSARA